METTVKVGEESKDLIAILKTLDEAYNAFDKYIDKYFGKDNTSIRSTEDDFYSKWCGVKGVVEDCLSQAMIQNLRDSNFGSI